MTNVGMLLLSRSKWLNVDRVANVHKRVSLTKSEVREEGGCVVFLKKLLIRQLQFFGREP
jgi:hypothetical protein